MCYSTDGKDYRLGLCCAKASVESDLPLLAGRNVTSNTTTSYSATHSSRSVSVIREITQIRQDLSWKPFVVRERYSSIVVFKPIHLIQLTVKDKSLV